VSRARLAIAALIVAAIAAFFAAGGARYFSFDNAQHLRQVAEEYYARHTWQAVAGYFILYVALTGLSLAAGVAAPADSR